LYNTVQILFKEAFALSRARVRIYFHSVQHLWQMNDT